MISSDIDIDETLNHFSNIIEEIDIKGALSGLRQFLATESPLKMMRNAFGFTSKAPFILE